MSNRSDISCDAVVIGSGMGGSTFAHALARRGFAVVVVDENEPIRHEGTDLSPIHVFRFGNRPYIGGLTKFYGASMYRLREMDFKPTEMEAGTTPGWPISYEDLEPFYGEAERLYRVHGSSVNDETEPARSSPWPHEPIPHQGPVIDLVQRVSERAGMPVAYIPRALDYDPARGGRCVLCQHCDAYYCPRDAKMDAEIAALRPAVASGFVNVLSGTRCLRVLTTPDGKRATGVRVSRAGEEFVIHARIVAVAGGVDATPLLLWRSRTDRHPHGLANGSRALGRFFAAHTQGWVFPIKPGVQRTPFHQKTFAIHSFYRSAPNWPYPTGAIQASGYIEPIGMSRRYLPFLRALLHNSFHVFVMTEGLPSPETGYDLSDDGATYRTDPVQNSKTFKVLRRHAIDIFRAAGYRVLASGVYGTRWHGVGTARMGWDPRTSIVDPFCRAHDVDGLYVVDASALPSPGAVNMGLTIAAVAMRAAANVPSTGGSADLSSAPGAPIKAASARR